MKTFKVTLTLEAQVEAASKEEVFLKVPPIPDNGWWEVSDNDPFQVEELGGGV